MGMDRAFIIVGEKCQCGVCFTFFRPDSEYHQRCESRTSFPQDFPKTIKTNPHAYCSEACEQIAIDEVRLARIEFERMLQETA